jgi:hypothetical protein
MAGDLSAQVEMFPTNSTLRTFAFMPEIRRESYKSMSAVQKGDVGTEKVTAMLRPSYWIWVGLEKNVPHDLCVRPRETKDHRDITLSLEVRTRESRDKAIPRLGEQDCPVIAVYSYVDDIVDFCVARKSGLYTKLIDTGIRPLWSNAFALDDIWSCWMESLTQKTVTTLGKPSNGTARQRI